MTDEFREFNEYIELLIEDNTENSYAIRSQGGDQMLADLLDLNSHTLTVCLEYINDKES